MFHKFLSWWKNLWVKPGNFISFTWALILLPIAAAAYALMITVEEINILIDKIYK